ncbi:MAG: hypothetical protein IJJ10_06590 [Bacillus sp. (in: Bacteria)]|nr:hypothetical protein [Bacillus sp. (in: firmicutes)]
MEFKAEANPEVRLRLDGKAEITLVTYKGNLRVLENLKDKELNIKIESFKKKRSISQNAYMWVLLNELAIKLNTTKDELYQTFIKDYGVFEILPIKNEACERFMKNWSKNGLGWFCIDIGDSKLAGYTKIMAYYGSSTYNSQEMQRVIDNLVQECNEQGINTMPIEDIMLLANENDSVC